jgi:hypothetical protein
VTEPIRVLIADDDRLVRAGIGLILTPLPDVEAVAEAANDREAVELTVRHRPRVALLDIFLAFFLVAAVACLAADRDWFRNRLAAHLERNGLTDLGGRFGPALIVRPWRIAAGLCFGLALGSKWNALYVLAAFALLSLAWDVGARRLAGAGTRAYWAVLRDGVPAFVSLVTVGRGIPGGSASWSSGFLPSTYSGTQFRSTGDPVLNVGNPAGIDDAAQRSSITAVNDLNRLHLAEV